MRKHAILAVLVGGTILVGLTPADALCNRKRNGICMEGQLARGLNADCTRTCKIAFRNGKKVEIIGALIRER